MCLCSASRFFSVLHPFVMTLMLYLYAGLLGACLGSFLTVVIHRLPRRESVVHPRSRCPQCQSPLAWYHNLPVLSYLWLRGRCATCRASIPRSYFLVEVGTALVFIGLFHGFGVSLLLPRYAMLAVLLIAAAEIDRRHGIIPNPLVVTGVVVGLAWVLATDAQALGVYGLAALVSAGLLLLIRIGSQLVMGRVGLGMGDVKLAAMMGLFLGWDTLWVFYLAVVLGGTLGLIGLLAGRLERTARLPMAPFVAVGAALHLFLVPPSLVLPLFGYVP